MSDLDRLRARLETIPGMREKIEFEELRLEVDRLREVMRDVSATLKSPDTELVMAVAMCWRSLDAALSEDRIGPVYKERWLIDRDGPILYLYWIADDMYEAPTPHFKTYVPLPYSTSLWDVVEVQRPRIGPS